MHQNHHTNVLKSLRGPKPDAHTSQAESENPSDSVAGPEQREVVKACTCPSGSLRNPADSGVGHGSFSIARLVSVADPPLQAQVLLLILPSSHE